MVYKVLYVFSIGKYNDDEFKGVFCEMNDEAGTKCMTFSAVSKNKSLWGVKYYK